MHLQRQYDLPHSSPKRELGYAQLLSQQLNRCAEQIVYSFSSDQSERELDWSPLLDVHASLVNEQPNDKITRIEEAHFYAIDLESLQDDVAPSVSLAEGVRGNSGLLETQALCPFKAFSEYRLYSKSYEEEALWLSRAMAGTIMHEILERFWRDTQSQQQLLAMGDSLAFAKLDQLLEDAFKKHINWQVPVLYLNVEKQRLAMLLQSFIILEQNRPAFKVEYLEEKRRFVLDEIPFEIRMDRIDLDEAGNRILIDYKSGQVSLYDLWSDRLKAVQLPLYYFQLPADKPKALVFAKLSTPVSYLGLGDTDFGIEGLQPLTSIRNQPYASMNDLSQHWQGQIKVLISEFKTGVARVDPLEGHKTCQFCRLSPFCRIHEQAVSHE
jgi:probable DNA repair protein